MRDLGYVQPAGEKEKGTRGSCEFWAKCRDTRRYCRPEDSWEQQIARPGGQRPGIGIKKGPVNTSEYKLGENIRGPRPGGPGAGAHRAAPRPASGVGYGWKSPELWEKSKLKVKE